MSDHGTLTCSRCGKAETRVKVKGMIVDPPGWGTASLSGSPVRNWLLCPWCVGCMRSLMAGEPAAVGGEAVTND
jgi:hypothetical protein